MSRGHREMNNFSIKITAPALIGIMPGDFIMVFGGSELEAPGEYLFPDNVKTKLVVSQAGRGHFPCIGFEIKPADSYNLSFVFPVKGSKITFFKLDSTADEKELDTLPPVLVPRSIIDANKKGADLVAVVIHREDERKLILGTYPPAVGLDEPFDGGATISRILSSSCVFAFIPRKHYARMMKAANLGMIDGPVDLTRQTVEDEAIEDAEEAPPKRFTVDVVDDLEVILFAKVHAAIEELREHQASKSTKQAASCSTKPGPNQQVEEVPCETEMNTKQMTLEQMLADLRLQTIRRRIDAGASVKSWVTPDTEAMKCKTCGEYSHYVKVASGKEPVKCYKW